MILQKYFHIPKVLNLKLCCLTFIQTKNISEFNFLQRNLKNMNYALLESLIRASIKSYWLSCQISETTKNVCVKQILIEIFVKEFLLS